MSSKVATSAASAGASAASKMIKLSPSVYFFPVPSSSKLSKSDSPSIASLSSDSVSDLGKDLTSSSVSTDLDTDADIDSERAVKVSKPASTNKSTPTSASASAASASASSSASGSGRKDPGLILLGTWMGAAPRHIEKYTDMYRRLFPSSPILLLRSEATDFMKPRAARENIRPAVGIVEAFARDPWMPLRLPAGLLSSLGEKSGLKTELLEKTGLAASSATAADTGATTEKQALKARDHEEKVKQGEAPMLIHVWSNGGSNSLYTLRRLCPSFPPYKLIMDSCPGQFHYRATYTAFSLTIPYPWLRRLLSPILHALCMWFWIRLRLPFLSAIFGSAWGRGKGGPLRVSADSHNEVELLEKDRGRTYIYSEEDALVPSDDVEKHAAQAMDRGFDVRLEKFVGSQHVAHAKTEPGRYWRLVREAWFGRDVTEVETQKAEKNDKEGGEKTASDEKTQLDTPSVQAA